MQHRFKLLMLFMGMGFMAGCGSGDSKISADTIENEATAENPKPEKTGPKGTPVFDDTVYNFKKVTSGMQVQHRYKFKNTGKGDLLIRNCQAACGCTTPGWTKEVIKPGEYGFVDATFNSTGRGAKEGLENEKSITVEFENSTIAFVMLKFKATVFSTPEEDLEYEQNNH
jgi:hypothetical protein